MFERMDEMYLSVFPSVLNRARETVSLLRLGTLSTRFFFVSSLCQETDFYIERVTVHCIKINDHSCFHNRLPNSN